MITLLCFVKINAQNSTNLIQKLKDKIWQIKDSPSQVKLLFDNNKHYASLEGKVIAEFQYYFTDNNCVNEDFDETKLGKVTSGKYMKMAYSCYDFELIDDNTFRMRNLNLDTGWITYISAIGGDTVTDMNTHIAKNAVLITRPGSHTDIVLRANGVVLNSKYRQYLVVNVPSSPIKETGFIFKNGFGIVGSYVLGSHFDTFKNSNNYQIFESYHPYLIQDVWTDDRAYNSLGIIINIEGYLGVKDLEVNIDKIYQNKLQAYYDNLPENIMKGYEHNEDEIEVVVEILEDLSKGDSIDRSVEVTFQISPLQGSEDVSGDLYDAEGVLMVSYEFAGDNSENGDRTATYSDLHIKAEKDISAGSIVHFTVHPIIHTKSVDNEHDYPIYLPNE